MKYKFLPYKLIGDSAHPMWPHGSNLHSNVNLKMGCQDTKHIEILSNQI
jgi:hypothetical protein